MAARTLMVQGTHSGAGKSVLVAALCRIFSRRGLRVAPFKAQNMSLNAAVTAQGHEIGRSTFYQAEAAGIEATVDMNPVLLKPEAERRSQLVVEGRVAGHLETEDWGSRHLDLWSVVTGAFDRLVEDYDLVVLEGAGSPAEINLRRSDIVNMAMARHAGAPVLLVGDIDRGGVFAALYGTVMLLPPEERRLVSGFVLNRFRGDPRLLGDGPLQLEARCEGISTLGVIPFLPDIGLPEEDSVPIEARRSSPEEALETDVVVLALPHMSNFDDFDPLSAEPGVSVRYVRRREDLGEPDAIILPGSKRTLDDLRWLRQQGLDATVAESAARGVAVVGICGGYQMLGRWIEDPSGIEAAPGTRALGLGLLPVVTVFEGEKRTEQVRFSLVNEEGKGPFAGLGAASGRAYEIHVGRTELLDRSRSPLFMVESSSGSEIRWDGVCAHSGRVWGTYLHQLFDSEEPRRSWLGTLGWRAGGSDGYGREEAYTRWADHVEGHLDVDAVARLVDGGLPRAGARTS